MLENILLNLQNFYALVERLQVTPGFLLGLSALFAVAGLLAMREAASWFFKVDDVKRDLARLQDTAKSLENELRLVQALLTKTQLEAEPIVTANASAIEKEKASPSSPSFPISH